MKNKAIQTLFLLLFALSVQAVAQTKAWERASNIQKGYNLANWLEAGWLGDSYPSENEYTKENMELFSKLGFDTVRVPVLYEWITSETPPYGTVINSTPFELIDEVVIPAADACGMTVLLVNHHGRPLNDANFRGEIPRIVGMWQSLAARYANLPHDRYFFELRNEPTYEISNANLRIVQQAIIDGIRAVDEERTLIVGANWWNAAWSLVQTTPYNDPQNNIIYTFHSYDPMDFTHQGFSWSPQHPLGVEFSPNSEDAAYLQSTLVDVKAWSQTHNVPIYWGEFGVSWFADAQDRCEYIDFATQIANELNIPWLYWDIKNTTDAFGIFENGVISENTIIPCFQNAMGLAYSPECGTPVENPPVVSPPNPPNPPNPPAGNSPCQLVTTSTFYDDFSGWGAWGIDATANNGWVVLNGATASLGNPWEAGFAHSEMEIKQGKTYTIIVDAYGSSRTVDLRVGLSVAPYTAYFYETIFVNPTAQSFSRTFTMTEPTTTLGSLDFYLGGVGGEVGLTNIRLEEIGCEGEPPAPPTPPAPVCPAAGTPCDDGDATTENDVEDGNCNCAGTPIPQRCDLVTNPTFDGGLDHWVSWGCDAYGNYGWAYIGNLWYPRANPWDAGLAHPDILLQQGKTYAVRFDALGANRSVDVRVGLGVAPYTSFHYEAVDVTWSTQSYEMTFTMTEPTTTLGSLDFYFGADTGDVALDNVTLKEAGCSR